MRTILVVSLLLLATPAPAQEAEPPTVFDQLENLLQNFLQHLAPQMEQLGEGLQAMEPELRSFLDRMQGMVQYHPPEILPNGDILIRRRAPEDHLPESPSPDDAPDEPSGPVTTPFEL